MQGKVIDMMLTTVAEMLNYYRPDPDKIDFSHPNFQSKSLE